MREKVTIHSIFNNQNWIFFLCPQVPWDERCFMVIVWSLNIYRIKNHIKTDKAKANPVWFRFFGLFIGYLELMELFVGVIRVMVKCFALKWLKIGFFFTKRVTTLIFQPPLWWLESSGQLVACLFFYKKSCPPL